MGMSQDMLLRMYKQMQDLQSENKLLRGQIEGWETPRASPLPKPSGGNAESSNVESKVAGNAGLNTEKNKSPIGLKQSMTTLKIFPTS